MRYITTYFGLYTLRAIARSAHKGPVRFESPPPHARFRTVIETESSVIYCRPAKSFRWGFVTFAKRNVAGAARRGAARRSCWKQIERHERQIIINTFVIDRYRPRRFPPAPLIDSRRESDSSLVDPPRIPCDPMIYRCHYPPIYHVW